MMLIVEEIDSETQCIEASAQVSVNNLSQISKLLEIDLTDDPNLEYEYEINEEAMILIKNALNIDQISGNKAGRIRRKIPSDDLPYLCHDGREFKLMMQGKKPLAFFAFLVGEEDAIQSVVRPFELQVESGVFGRWSFELTGRSERKERSVAYLVYTVKGEEWRARALEELKRAGWLSGWSEGMERMESSLLGYKDWEIDYYLRSRARNIE